MLNIEKLMKAISLGVGERCGCNDGDDARAKEWIKLAKSKKPDDQKLLLHSITEAVAYGG